MLCTIVPTLTLGAIRILTRARQRLSFGEQLSRAVQLLLPLSRHMDLCLPGIIVLRDGPTFPIASYLGTAVLKGPMAHVTSSAPQARIKTLAVMA